MVKLVIFDLDGTLLNTLEDIANACNHALEECGCPTRKLEEYNMMVGRGIDNLFRAALPEGKKTDGMVAKMREAFIPWYDLHKCDLTRPYEGITTMLDSLEKMGVRFAVASNKYQEGTEPLVRRIFAGYGFVRILGQREGKPIKPDPMIVHEAMEGMPGIRSEEVVYCGDSDVDMMTGTGAGVRTIGVTWGFRSREELEAYGPDLIADTPQEITDYIKTLNLR